MPVGDSLKKRLLGGFVRVVCFSVAAPLIPIAALATTVHLSNSLGPSYAQIVGFPVEQLCVAVLLIQLITFGDSGAWKWLNSSPARFVGRISYSLYLYHALSFHYLPNPLRNWVEESSRPVKVLVGIAISVGFSVISYYGIERAFLKLKRKHESLNGGAPRLKEMNYDAETQPHERRPAASEPHLAVEN